MPTHSITLAWIASIDSVAGYNVYRGTSAGTETSTKINPSLVSALTYVDTNVVAGTTYFYKVTSVNFAGAESASSAEASATVPFAPPTGLTAKAV
jgi:fibronectin type 3 domain-containing protein